MIVPLGGGLYDIRLRKYVKVGESWIVTRIEMVSGQTTQTEDYSEVRIDADLSPNLFEPSSWTTARHWHTSDAQQIRAMLDSTAAGWNRGDLSLYMSAYADSTTSMGANGLVHGRSATEQTMRAGFWKSGRPLQMLHYESVEVRMLGADHALVTGKFVLSGANRPDRSGWFTTIWARTGDGWRMIHDHSS
jgi:uncharacterized protein (TIGR02246 family)